MAKPQLENGHTQIANEIVERLAKTHLSPNQWQVMLCVIRKTYGFHKKVDYIANFQIMEATGLCKAVVSRCLKGLSDMEIITRKGKYIGFQKDWERWKQLAEQSTELAVSSTQLAEQSTKVSSPAVAQKIKETIQKKLFKRYGEFNNVLLTDEQYNKLRDKYSDNGAKDWIEILSRGIASKGYKYKDHYATILNWVHRDEKDKKPGSRELPTTQQMKDEYDQGG